MKKLLINYRITTKQKGFCSWLIMLTFFLSTALLHSQGILTRSIDISTGVDRVNSGTLPTGTTDPFWIVVQDPLPATAEPRATDVIAPFSGWSNPITGSQWISYIPTSANGTNGLTTFEACFYVFSVQPGQSVWLTGSVLYDDIIPAIRINGNQVISFNQGNGFGNPSQINVDISQYLNAGNNTIQIDVRNTAVGRFGVDLSATISTISNNLSYCNTSNACCNDFYYAADVTSVTHPDPTLPGSYTGNILANTVIITTRPATKVSTTIVRASINGQPVFGHFRQGLIRDNAGQPSPFLWGIVRPVPFGRELIWFSNPAAPLNQNSFLLYPKFPAIGPGDVLQFTILYRFTDSDCKTCEFLVDYEVPYTDPNSGGGVGTGGSGGTHTGGTISPSNDGTFEENQTTRILDSTPGLER